jgi:hypothetical protein
VERDPTITLSTTERMETESQPEEEEAETEAEARVPSEEAAEELEAVESPGGTTTSERLLVSLLESTFKTSIVFASFQEIINHLLLRICGYNK